MTTYNIATPNTSAVYPVNPLESQYMQMLLSEQRTQGSELRMNMNKLETKIEKVLDKLNLCDRSDRKHKPELEDEILELEEKLLMLKNENRKLKQNLHELSSNETEEKKLKYVLFEYKEDLSNFDIDYRQDIKSILQQLTDNLKESFKTTQMSQKQLLENEMKFNEQQKEIALQTSNNLQLQNELTTIKELENDTELKLKDTELEVLNLKEELSKTHTKLQEKPEASLKTPDESVVKSLMNNLYVDIEDKLKSSNSPETEQTLSLIAASIRQQTLKFMQEMRKDSS